MWPGQQRLHPFGAALVRHVGELRAGRLLDLDHHQLAGAADAAGAVGVLLGLGLAGGEQVLDRLPGRVGPHHDADRVRRQPGDVGEVAQRVPGHLLVVRIAQAVDAHAGQRVAVGLGASAAPPAPACRRHRRLASTSTCWPRMLADLLAEEAQVQVGDAAGRERVVDDDRALGLPASRLRADDRGRGEQRCRGRRPRRGDGGRRSLNRSSKAPQW